MAEYLLTTSHDVDVSAALSVMPYTQSEYSFFPTVLPLIICLLVEGMDLNPDFTSATTFHPSDSTAGGELKLFEHVNIPLLHGWLVDPGSPEAAVLRRIHDYDTAVNLIAEVDHLTNGRFVVDELAPQLHQVEGSATSPTREWTDEELKKVQDGMYVLSFLP